VDEPPLNCFYCKNNLNLNDWKSDWHDEKHYHSLVCECGKKNWCETDFISSGHSIINEQLESVIREVCDISCSK
jgi:hypothetical protein